MRDGYPSTSKFGRRGVGMKCVGFDLPPPISVMQGTAEKVAILEQRAAQGLSLFNPADGLKEDGVFYIVGHRPDGSSIVIEEKAHRDAAVLRRDELAKQLQGYTEIVVQSARDYEPPGRDDGETTKPATPPAKDDRIQLLKERHDAMKANDGLPNRKLAEMLRQLGPLARLDEAQRQAEKEGMGLSEPTFYKYKRALFPDAPRTKPGPTPKTPATAARETPQKPVAAVPKSPAVAPTKPLEALAETIAVLHEVKTLCVRVGGAPILRQLIDILE